MERKNLSDTYIRGRKPAPKGKRYETMDTECPRLGLRVTDKGAKSFIYFSRFPGSPNPTRRALGRYPLMTLAKAREKARKWDALLADGIDPREAEEQRRAEAERAKVDAADNTFEAHARRYVRFAKKNQRRWKEGERLIEKELMPHWRDRQIDSITPKEVKARIIEIAERSDSVARNVLTICKSFFDWALDEDSPAAALKPKKVIGKKRRRDRLLSDDELRALWNATGEVGYPYQHLYRLLMLTGVRLREAADARWGEFDMDKRLWTIPSERFKSECVHLVPLSGRAVRLLENVPRFQDGDYLFSHRDGRAPVNSFSKAKQRVDALMAESLGAPPPPWVIHDLRRAVRTNMAKMKIDGAIAEMVLGHGHGDALQRTYDLHEYEDELRDALERWAARLRDIVEPPDPDKVVKMRTRA